MALTSLLAVVGQLDGGVGVNPPLTRLTPINNLVLDQDAFAAVEQADPPLDRGGLVKRRQVGNVKGGARVCDRRPADRAGRVERGLGDAVDVLVAAVVQQRVLALGAAPVVQPAPAVLVLALKVARAVVVVLTQVTGPPFTHGVEDKVTGVEITV